MILHCMKKETWEERKNKKEWGYRDIEKFGFVHCSTLNNIGCVTPNWKELDDELVIICIDENNLSSEVKFEDLDNYGIEYPHVYGAINNSAIIAVLPYLKDNEGNWIMNKELPNLDSTYI